MTVSTTTRRAGPFVGDGSATSFPFAFKVFQPADVYVVQTQTLSGASGALALGTDYSVSLNADQNANPGGTVTTTSALASGYTLLITSNVQAIQSVSLGSTGGFYPEVVNDALDRQTILVQQILERIAGMTGSGGPALPYPTANYLLGWDALGRNLANVNPATLGGGGGGSSSASGVTYTPGGTGAVPLSVQAKLRGSLISALDYSADLTGATDSTSALNNALAAAAGNTLLIEPGVYKLGSAGLNAIPSGTTILGYGATLRRSAAPSAGFLSASAASHINIFGLTFDDSEFVSSPTNAQVNIYNCNSVTIRDCQFIKWRNFGLSVGDSTQVLIENNFFQRTTAVNTVTMAINIFAVSGYPMYTTIRGNRLVNAGMNATMAYSEVIDNVISGWRYGGAIVTQQDPKAANITISRNICVLSYGTDVDATNCPGIESWAPFSVVTGNICISCSGSGIDMGSKQSVVTGNLCANNGTTGGSGIALRYGTSSYNASGSVVTGNVCFDTGGAGGTQSYGVEEQSSSLTDLQITGNALKGNKTGPQRILSATTNFVGPSVTAQWAWSSPTSIASGASTLLDVTVAGARMGDFVQVSYSNDLQGLVATAYTRVDNTVRISLANATPSAITLAAGTFTIRANKHAQSVDI